MRREAVVEPCRAIVVGVDGGGTRGLKRWKCLMRRTRARTGQRIVQQEQLRPTSSPFVPFFWVVNSKATKVVESSSASEQVSQQRRHWLTMKWMSHAYAGGGRFTAGGTGIFSRSKEEE
jgi:hypothetical protein